MDVSYRLENIKTQDRLENSKTQEVTAPNTVKDELKSKQTSFIILGAIKIREILIGLLGPAQIITRQIKYTCPIVFNVKK